MIIFVFSSGEDPLYMYIEALMDEAISYRKKIKSNIADVDVSRDKILVQ